MGKAYHQNHQAGNGTAEVVQRSETMCQVMDEEQVC
jgi:hypothetical protein